MFRLTFLGTSASVPSADRNHPGLLVEAGGTRVLVDCGEGTQRQLLRSGNGFRRLNRLLLTHAHFDHILGIPGLFSTLALQQSSEGMTVYGGAGSLEVCSRMFTGLWGEDRAPIPLKLVALADGQVIDCDDFQVTCFPVSHRDTDSYAFSFTSRARRHLLRDRLAALDVPDGPVRGELAAGRAAALPDGRVIDPENVLGPQSGSRKLVVVGDVGNIDGLARIVQGADVLVIEATFLQRDAAIARDYGHITATEAATLALDANVGRLILNHMSGRYPAEEVEAEAVRTFANSRVAVDFDRFEV